MMDLMTRPPRTLDAISVRAKQISTPLLQARTVSPEESAPEVLSRMSVDQFDHAPVFSEGIPVGVFPDRGAELHSITGKVGEHVRPLDASILISGEAKIGALIKRLQSEPFLFVVEEDSIASLLTAADLGSIHVRTHFYAHLSHLESLLSNFLRTRHMDQQAAVQRLKTPRKDSCLSIAEDLKKSDRFLDYFSCVSLQDLIDLAGAHPDFKSAVREAGLGWNRADRGFGEFRDAVMHSSRPLSGSEYAQPDHLLKMQTRIDALTHAAIAAGSGFSGSVRE